MVNMSLADSKLSAVLSDWPDYGFDSAPRLEHTFTEGLNHRTYRLSYGAAHQVVLKIFSTPMPNAVASQEWGAKLGIAPQVRFASEDNDLLIMEHIDAPHLGSRPLSNLDLPHIGIALKLLHSSSDPSLEKRLGDFDLLAFCDTYLEGLDRQIHKTHLKLRPILDIFINDPTPWALCHNDLVRENCFTDQGKVSFIDWEYTQRHNPWFDLAAIVLYSHLSLEQSKLLLENYSAGWGDKTDQAIFCSAQCALLWGDILWHLAKFGMSYSSAMHHKWLRLETLTSSFEVDLNLSFAI